MLGLKLETCGVRNLNCDLSLAKARSMGDLGFTAAGRYDESHRIRDPNCSNLEERSLWPASKAPGVQRIDSKHHIGFC